MRTALQSRCDDAWTIDDGEDLRLSLAVFRRTAVLERTGATNIYVVYDASADAVKIGFAAHPKARFSNLQTATSHPLELVFSVPARVGLEKLIHQHLAEDRIRGEWFRLTHRVLVALELLMSADDFYRTAADIGEEWCADMTTEVLCGVANAYMDVAAGV